MRAIPYIFSVIAAFGIFQNAIGQEFQGKAIYQSKTKVDMDFEGRPFGPMPYLLAVAEFVTKVHAICAQTGELASYSFRLVEEDNTVLIGEKQQYEARSRASFIEGMKERKNK